VANELGVLIGAAVTRAETDFKSYRDRALSVVGLAGGLVTLTAGFLSIAAGSDKDFLPDNGRILVLLALLSYVSATVCALVVHLPSGATEVDPAVLKEFAEKNWGDEGWDQQAAVFSASYLTSLDRAIRSMARLLTLAIACEIAGITFTALMAIVVVRNLP
jgi:hypothetical protein